MPSFDIVGNHLTGITGLLLLFLTGIGVIELAEAVTTWFNDRFEWDRPSWCPWTWRAYRRWFAPGQLVELVESEDAPLGRVLDVSLGESRAAENVLDTWLFVQPYPEDDDHDDRPYWTPLADVIPAPVGPFADDLALTDYDRAA